MSSFFESAFAESKELNYLDSNVLDFPIKKIGSEPFVEFLKSIDEEVYDDHYPMTVTTMCEYYCYWAWGKLKNTDVINDMKMVAGCFGFFEHHWLLYKDQYIIDGTLAQFIEDAPKIAILNANESYGKSEYNNPYVKDNDDIEYFGEFFMKNVI